MLPFHLVSLVDVTKKVNKAAKKLMLAIVRTKPTSIAAKRSKIGLFRIY